MEKRIIALFQKEKKALSFREIKEKLMVKEEKSLHQAIDSLLKENILIEGEKGKLLASFFFVRGLLVIRSNKTAFVIDKESGEKVEVKNQQQWGALHKDEVLVNPQTGRILRVLVRNTYFVTGVIRQDRRGRFSFESDTPLPETYRVINLKSFSLKKNSLVAGFISHYQRQEITLEKVLGAEASLEVSQKAILYHHHLPTSFEREVLAEAEAFAENIAVENHPHYRDDRDLWVVTIDGDDSKDFDDAISLDKSDKGYCLRVHIADVAHYVKENSPLDKAAKERGTSVYYPNAVIPMLPEKLSNGLCSLNPHQDRLSLTAEMHYDLQGELKDVQFYPAIIRSHARLTYAKVNAFYQGEETYREEKTQQLLKDALCLARLLQEKAKEKGSISFDTKEPKFVVENGKVKEILLRERGEAEMLIESFMIEANCAVAKFLAKRGYPALYRNHDLPKEEKIDAFFREIVKLGYVLPAKEKEWKAKDFAECLAYFRDFEAYPLVNDRLLRAMSKAKYSENNEGHFALSKEYYCHFTSPIRRYPDLFVHRMLHQYLFHDQEKNEEKNQKRAKISAAISNETEERAVQIEREMNDLLQVWYMADHVGEYFQGVISGLTNFGIFVELENGIEGMIPLRSLANFFQLGDDDVLSDGNKSYRFGDKIEVRLAKVDRARRSIDFTLAKAKKKRRQQRWR